MVAMQTSSTSTTSMKPSKRRKYSKVKKSKGPPKPKRALSAYNLYTALCRERIRNGIDLCLPVTTDDVLSISLQNKMRKRREHRKTSPGMSLEDMSKLIISRWKNLPPEQRTLFEQEANILKQEREVALQKWKDQVQSQQEQKHQEGGDATASQATESADSSRTSSPAWSSDGNSMTLSYSETAQAPTFAFSYNPCGKNNKKMLDISYTVPQEDSPAPPFWASIAGGNAHAPRNDDQPMTSLMHDDLDETVETLSVAPLLTKDDLAPSILTTEDVSFEPLPEILGDTLRVEYPNDKDGCSLLDNNLEDTMETLPGDIDEARRTNTVDDELASHLDQALLNPLTSDEMDDLF